MATPLMWPMQRNCQVPLIEPSWPTIAHLEDAVDSGMESAEGRVAGAHGTRKHISEFGFSELRRRASSFRGQPSAKLPARP